MYNQLFCGTASGTAVLPWQYRAQVPIQQPNCRNFHAQNYVGKYPGHALTNAAPVTLHWNFFLFSEVSAFFQVFIFEIQRFFLPFVDVVALNDVA